jgi:hypothetical protein
MGVNGNGVSHQPAAAGPRASNTPRAPRRVVLLVAGEQSDAAEVLAEYKGADVSGNRLHADVQRLAAGNPGRWVAAEWLGPLGWTRFLWCRK